MKKMIALLLGMVMVLSTLSACQPADNIGTSAPEEKTTESVIPRER